MSKLALFVRLEAEPGQEAAVASLMANAAALLGAPPTLEKVDPLAAKLPG